MRLSPEEINVEFKKAILNAKEYAKNDKFLNESSNGIEDVKTKLKSDLENGKAVVLFPSNDNQGGNLAMRGWIVPFGVASGFIARGYTAEINQNSERALKELYVLAQEAQDKLALTSSEREEFEKYKQEKSEKQGLKAEKQAKNKEI